MSTTTLTEDIQLARGHRVDKANGVVRGVKLLGLQSRNGREYLAEAVSAARSLYEGTRVYIGHAPKGRENEVRGYELQFGHLAGVEFRQASGLYADLHFNPKHALAEQFAWDAEYAPHRIGLSHAVDGRTSMRGGKVVVESITKVRSVDLVTQPATTAGLYESAGHVEPITRAEFLEAITGRPNHDRASVQAFVESLTYKGEFLCPVSS